jgi:hypothetical protein
MCLIILKPKWTQMPDGMLERASRLNPNGAGCARCDGNSVEVTTGTGLSYRDRTELWHFRYALSGVNDVKSIQPFLSLQGMTAFAHVGVLKDMSAQTEHSDSYNFFDTMSNFLNCCKYNSAYKRLLDAYCNVTQNRMVLLGNTGNYWIFGEQNGYWDQGLWLSGMLDTVDTTSDYL